jgi:hypothetical protein
MSLNSIFFISAFFHKNEIYAATKYFNIPMDSVFIILQESDDHMAIRLALIQELNISPERIVVFKKKYLYYTFLIYVRLYIIFNRVGIFKYPNINYFTSQYNNTFDLVLRRIFRPSVSYVLDEGDSSRTVAKLRNQNFYNAKTIFKSFYFASIFKETKNIVYFTKWDFEINDNDIVIKHDYFGRKLEIHSFDHEQHILLGNNFIELGLVTEEEFIITLRKIRTFSLTNKVFWYFPHRLETYKSIELVEKAGFTVLCRNGDFELFYCKLHSPPLHVHNFLFSSFSFILSRRLNPLPRFYIHPFDSSQFDSNVYLNLYADEKIFLMCD